MNVNKLTSDCVIVTFNKLNLLRECVNAVLNQTVLPNNIFIVDNNSSDGTREYIQNLQKTNPKIKGVFLERNIGGAGGFNKGIRRFIQHDQNDFVWIMDDDTIPEADCLERLIEGAKSIENVGFLCSKVIWTDGTPAIMNVPSVTSDWPAYSHEKMAKVLSASFVSLLVSRNAIEKVGLPIADFFIWGDDAEFTYRIHKEEFNNALVYDSVALHKMKKNVGISIREETDASRIKRYFYEYRNSIYRTRKDKSSLAVIKEIIKRFFFSIAVLFSNSQKSGLKCMTIFRGTVAGLFFNPKIEKAEQ